MKIGLLREEKIPADKRVPLAPVQCRELMDQYQGLTVVVQPSNIRAFTDEEYLQQGVVLQEDLSDCDLLMGVKEVPKDKLIAGKRYLFFSHTHKRQPYNRPLLQEAIRKNIELIDYELITDAGQKRLIGFGRYAGIVGAYNGFLAWGKKTGAYELKPAHLCADKNELERELKKIVLPKNFKLVFTGGGRVGGGTAEILHAMGISQAFPIDIITKTYDEPVFAQLNVEDYNERLDGKPFKRTEFFRDPVGYRSTFMQYADKVDMYIACHFWDNRSPFIFTREDAKSPNFKIKVVADISCDIDCAVASTLRAATIEEPLYGYDPQREEVVDFLQPGSIGVMAVDNLPCELPRDASFDFGNDLRHSVLKCFLESDPDRIIARATIAKNGQLCSDFAYLSDWVAD